ncbi:amino acid ABC transporter substrate-binding protein [Thermogladius sp. 4427co]|uniref:amino acid ABC transporter substrate-binding protein n=1 Tax=Thermogladius sp. 4427co TaxID=3450718 RepID=UPI003F796459
MTKPIYIISIILVVLSALAGYYAGIVTGPAKTITMTTTYTTTVTQTYTVYQTTLTTPITQTTPLTQSITCNFTVPDKLVIGLSISLTGSFALTGQQGLWGMKAAVNWLNNVKGGIDLCGKKVKLELKYYDDQSSKDLVPSLYERLITVDHVNFLLGPYGSPLTLAAAPVAEKYNMLLVSWMANSDKLYMQGFRFFVMVPAPASTLWKAALEMVHNFDPSAKVAILYKEDEFNTVVANGARNISNSLGLNVVMFRSYPTDISDFTPLFNELATIRPDVILICSHEKDGMLAMQQLIQMKINAKLIGIAVAASLPDFYKNFGTMAEGIIDGTHWSPYAKWSPQVASSMGYEWLGPTQEEFISLFKQVAGPDKSPSYHAAAGFASILILAKAIEKAQSLDQLAVRNAFNDLKVMTVYGPFAIDPSTGRQIAHTIVVGQWQAGTFQIVYPPGAASSKPVYPIPTWDEKAAGKLATPTS